MHPRTREMLEALPPEKRAAAEAALARVIARRATPEARAELDRVRELVMEEFPPARTAPPELAELMSALRAERERQGLSLADVAARSGLDRSMLCRLENGQIPNPTINTLARYAAVLNKRVALVVRDVEPVGG